MAFTNGDRPEPDLDHWDEYCEPDVDPNEVDEGSLAEILDGKFPKEPRLQLLDLELLQQQRYRLLLSDRRNTYSFAMLAFTKNSLVDTGKLTPFSIIVLKRYLVDVRQKRSLIIILDAEVCVPGDQVSERLGSPVSLENDMSVADGASGEGRGSAKPARVSMEI
ncbi:replication protein A 70 kDa DNA-binding subunit-like [Paramacrobiotus metropolitanus]|uniref:replication protein A 70 kDa DNA-binding subunit-like n=1 Tax=Paramacrobiotus metropolitanus TaxID=2943436 RepID=UPI0024461A2F|nr:replication protein A 70 kDa DNA-binding subunit-like [Paramacrobiotus metropolitanus]